MASERKVRQENYDLDLPRSLAKRRGFGEAQGDPRFDQSHQGIANDQPGIQVDGATLAQDGELKSKAPHEDPA